MFDANEFMQTQMDKPLETEYTLVPIGEYMMTIDDFTADAFEVINFEYKKGERAGTPGSMTKVTIPFVVQDDKIKKEMQRDKVIVGKQLILEFEDDGKTIATGPNKNIELGRIKAAVGQDKGPWSFANLRGAGPFMGKVTHVEYQRKDGSKGKRAEIERVTRIV
jgi:hypothetical protein